LPLRPPFRIIKDTGSPRLDRSEPPFSVRFFRIRAPVDENFDPYWKWLGIPPEEQPPNHYRLLGIALFEEDAEVINNAADRQMAHMRTVQTGKRAAMSQGILNELSTAKVCLLDPVRKQAYDARLRGDRSTTTATVGINPAARGIARPVSPTGGPAVASPPRPVAVSPRAVTAVASGEGRVDLPRAVTISVPRARRRSSGSPVVGAVLAIGMLVVLGLIVWSMIGEKSPTQRGGEEPRSSGVTKKPAKTSSEQVEAVKNGGSQLKKDARSKIRRRKTSDTSPPVIDGSSELPIREPPSVPADEPKTTDPPSVAKPNPDKTDAKSDKKNPPDAEKSKSETPPLAKRIPLPPKALVERAYRLSHPAYKQSIADAKTPAKKIELAKEIQTKAETEPDPATGAALWELARNLAVLAAEPAAACEIIDTLAARFDVDPFEHKRLALDEINRLVLKPDDYRKVLPVCKRLVGEAMAIERYDAAVGLAKVAKIAAGKTKDVIDIKEANAQLEDVAELERIVQNFKKFEKQLAENPDSDVANLHAGRYYCVVRGDWPKAVAALAKSNDSKLADLAKHDTTGAKQFAAQLELGDGWLEQAKRRGSVYRQPFAGRARYWYEQARGQAADADQEKIAGKIAEIEAVLKPGL
jgi:hypothetical protein